MHNTLPHHEILFELYAGIIALGKEALSIYIKHFIVQTSLFRDKVINTQKMMSLDSQKESDNELGMRGEEEAASLAKPLLDCDAGTKHTSQDDTANTPTILVGIIQSNNLRVSFSGFDGKQLH